MDAVQCTLPDVVGNHAVGDHRRFDLLEQIRVDGVDGYTPLKENVDRVQVDQFELLRKVRKVTRPLVDVRRLSRKPLVDRSVTG